MAQVTQDEPFPWRLNVYDSHCHPTDTMSDISTIPSMKTRILTVMATRFDDQDLVTRAADKYGIKSSNPANWSREECIVPCFGWHPWFSHQMYFHEDTSPSSPPKPLTDEEKITHYSSVLQPLKLPLDTRSREKILSLPSPLSFPSFLATTKRSLEQHPYALVGEIGLDRSFRIPESWDAVPHLWKKRDAKLTPGGREGRALTPFTCTPAHQRKIFKAQLQLAASLGRAVSVHAVQAHGAVFATMAELWKGHEREVLSKRERRNRGRQHPSVHCELDHGAASSSEPKPYPPRICLHSYSGSASSFEQYLDPKIPVRFYASFSTAINLNDALEADTPESFGEIVRCIPEDRLLVESDLHTAGEEMDRRMEDIVRRICRIKGWRLEHGVRRLGRNWEEFVFGESSGRLMDG